MSSVEPPHWVRLPWPEWQLTLPSTQTLCACVILLVTYSSWKLWSGLREVGYLPGLRIPFGMTSLVGAVIPSCWWNPGLNWSWEYRGTSRSYFNYTHDVISSVPFLLGKAVYYVGSVEVAKQLLANEMKIPLEKPKEMFAALVLWGDNLVSVNGETWKRHKRIVGPAFNPSIYNMAVREVTSLYHEMIATEEWAKTKASSVLPNMNHISVNLAMCVISRCAFGVRMNWTDHASAENNEDMSFTQALEIVMETHIPKLITPSWAYYLPIKSVQRMDKAYKSLANMLKVMARRRKEELNSVADNSEEPSPDLFTRLIAAWDTDAKHGLNESEVIGNTFTFMFAGHETTAHVLTATMAFLALYEDEQKKVYDEITSVLQNGRDPTLEDFPQFKYLSCCFLEAARIYPSAFLTARDCKADVCVRVQHPEPRDLCIPKNSRIIIDFISMHHNPNTFPEPEVFRPSRWMDATDSMMTMFASGNRACIGRKFAQVEGVTFLALFLRDFKLDIALNPGETRDMWNERVMGRAKMVGLAFGIDNVPLRISKRTVL
ncbi:cytochrome P450 [Panus rudis PR-1116 ss-1]|nr:cytochrome P450 [Panus rudis PR-1116 ss-1]